MKKRDEELQKIQLSMSENALIISDLANDKGYYHS